MRAELAPQQVRVSLAVCTPVRAHFLPHNSRPSFPLHGFPLPTIAIAIAIATAHRPLPAATPGPAHAPTASLTLPACPPCPTHPYPIYTHQNTPNPGKTPISPPYPSWTRRDTVYASHLQRPIWHLHFCTTYFPSCIHQPPQAASHRPTFVSIPLVWTVLSLPPQWKPRKERKKK